MDAMDTGLEEACEAERGRCRALETGDKEAVAALLHPDLIYVHSNGVIHDRAVYVALYFAADIHFQRCERRNLSAWRSGDVVLMSGEIIVVEERPLPAPPVETIAFITQTYVRDDSGWRMAQLHATKDTRDERGH